MIKERKDLQHRLQIEVGARMQRARKDAGQGQKNLAGRLGLSRTSISNIERGTQRIFIDQLYETADFLRIDVRELLPPVADMIVATVTVSDRERVSPAVFANALVAAKAVQAELEDKHRQISTRTRAKLK